MRAKRLVAMLVYLLPLLVPMAVTIMAVDPAASTSLVTPMASPTTTLQTTNGTILCVRCPATMDRLDWEVMDVVTQDLVVEGVTMAVLVPTAAAVAVEHRFRLCQATRM